MKIDENIIKEEHKEEQGNVPGPNHNEIIPKVIIVKDLKDNETNENDV